MILNSLTVSIQLVVVTVSGRCLELSGTGSQIVVIIAVCDVEAQLNIRDFAEPEQGKLSRWVS